MTAPTLTEYAATGERVHIAVTRLLEHVPASALPALATATQRDVLDTGGISRVADPLSPRPHLDALEQVYDGLPRHDALPLWAIWHEVGVTPVAAATLLATARQDQTRSRFITRLLLCGPSAADTKTWAATPPVEETVALLLALRGYHPEAPVGQVYR